MGATLTPDAATFNRAVVVDGEMSGQFVFLNTETMEWIPEGNLREAEDLLAKAQEAADDIAAMFRQMHEDGDAHCVAMMQLRKERDELFRAIEATH